MVLLYTEMLIRFSAWAIPVLAFLTLVAWLKVRSAGPGFGS